MVLLQHPAQALQPLGTDTIYGSMPAIVAANAAVQQVRPAILFFARQATANPHITPNLPTTVNQVMRTHNPHTHTVNQVMRTHNPHTHTVNLVMRTHNPHTHTVNQAMEGAAFQPALIQTKLLVLPCSTNLQYHLWVRFSIIKSWGLQVATQSIITARTMSTTIAVRLPK